MVGFNHWSAAVAGDYALIYIPLWSDSIQVDAAAQSRHSYLHSIMVGFNPCQFEPQHNPLADLHSIMVGFNRKIWFSLSIDQWYLHSIMVGFNLSYFKRLNFKLSYLHSIMVGFNHDKPDGSEVVSSIYIPLWSDSIPSARHVWGYLIWIYIPLWSDSIIETGCKATLAAIFTFHYGRIQSKPGL